MNELAPRLTDDGKAYVIGAMNGDGITFTKIVIGNGTQSDATAGTFVNPVITIGLTAIEVHDDYVLLTGEFDNADVASGFYMNELGVYAKNMAEEEVLYAYRYLSDDVDYIPAADSGNVVETQISIIVSIGDADNVTAILTEGAAYATKAAFEEHASDTNNPHQVTAEQIGLGNVPDVSTNDQTPTYEIPASAAALVSGETLSTAFGKLARAVANLIAHIASTTIHITSAERNAWNAKAAGTHKHSGADITSGTVALARGGTGAGDAANARKNIGVNAIYKVVSYTSDQFTFSAAGSYVQKDITITAYSGYTAVGIVGWAVANDSTSGSRDGYVAVNNITCGSNKVNVHLQNRYSGANHCKFSVTVLYLKNL